MTRVKRAVGRAVLLAALALTSQSSTCHFHSCTGDDCNDEDDENHGSETKRLVLPPLRDPLGRPMTAPIPVHLWSEPPAQRQERAS